MLPTAHMYGNHFIIHDQPLSWVTLEGECMYVLFYTQLGAIYVAPAGGTIPQLFEHSNSVSFPLLNTSHLFLAFVFKRYNVGIHLQRILRYNI